MKIAIGCDHGALALKNKVVAHLKERGFEVADFGTYSLDSCDYPDFAGAAAKAVAGGECGRPPSPSCPPCCGFSAQSQFLRAP